MATQTTEMFNPYKVAIDTFQHGMETAVKFQKEAAETFMSATKCGTDVDSARERIQSLANESMDMIRQNAERTQKVFDDICRTGLDTFQRSVKAMTSGQTKGEELMKDARTLWENTLDAMRATTDAMTRANTELVEGWTQFANKTFTAAEKRAPAKAGA